MRFHTEINTLSSHLTTLILKKFQKGGWHNYVRANKGKDNFWVFIYLARCGVIGYFTRLAREGNREAKKTWGPNSLGGPKILLKRLVMGATVKRVMGV